MSSSRRVRLALPWAFWLITRAYGVLIILDEVPYLERNEILGDPRMYEQWSQILAGGAFPEADPAWQYPPGAGAVFLAPRLLDLAYLTAFALMVLIGDLLVMMLLTRRARLGGAWAWALGVALLGPISYVRYDLVVTLVAVLALVLVAMPARFGVLVAGGALLKVWPALLVLALPRDRRGLAGLFAAAVAGGAAVAALSLTMGRGPWRFLEGQANRGLELEAVAATPVMLARLLGWPGGVEYRYGAVELTGPYVDGITSALLPMTAAALLLVAVGAWRRSGRDWDAAFGCDAALAAVLVLVVTARVLSPQYLLWLIGIGAVCLTHQATRQRGPVVLITIAAGLTQFLYPIRWQSLVAGEPLEVWVLAARNALLLAAALLAVRSLFSKATPSR